MHAYRTAQHRASRHSRRTRLAAGPSSSPPLPSSSPRCRRRRRTSCGTTHDRAWVPWREGVGSMASAWVTWRARGLHGERVGYMAHARAQRPPASPRATRSVQTRREVRRGDEATRRRDGRARGRTRCARKAPRAPQPHCCLWRSSQGPRAAASPYTAGRRPARGAPPSSPANACTTRERPRRALTLATRARSTAPARPDALL